MLINTALMTLLLFLAGTVWFMMGKVMVAANRINETNVLQLQSIAELDLNSHGLHCRCAMRSCRATPRS